MAGKARESRGLARELGTRGITANTIQPGPIDTELNPAAGDWAAPQTANTALGRYGTVDEVAALVAFVAAPGPRTSRARASPWMGERTPDRGRKV